jgi:hypothetical protein
MGGSDARPMLPVHDRCGRRMLGLACGMTFFSPRFGCLAGLVALLALMTGCASPGPPRAPSLHLPERITNLSAERRGNTVVLRFATPERTTDNEPLTGAVTASLCRAVGSGPCRATGSFPGKVAISGAVEWMDALPPELTAGAGVRLTYRVELFNAVGRSAGPSDPAFAIAGEAPHRVEDLRAEGSRGGVVLRWTPDAQPTGVVLVKREALNAAASTKRSAPPAKTVAIPAKRKKRGAKAKPSATVASSQDENTVWLQPSGAGVEHDSGGMVDATASVDGTYRYTAVRSRDVTLEGHKLEARSEPSAAVTTTLRDVYPPASPQGLLAAGFPVQGADTIAVDLVWQPNTESDLTGYNVYRQVLTAAGLAGLRIKLNDKPVALPAFHDATAARGMAYRYVVTAVDAKGNESGTSEPAGLDATP